MPGARVLLDRTGMPQIWPDSALISMVCPDSTSSGVYELQVELASN